MKLRDDITCYGKMAALKTGLVCGRVEVTSDCFQQCRLCDSWRSDQPKGVWQLKDIQRLFREALAFPDFQHLTLTGGDPQAWPYLDQFLTWASDYAKNIHRTCCIQINTALLKSPKIIWSRTVDKVWVSLDAINPNLYKKMRGCSSVEEVLENIMVFNCFPRIQVSTMTTVSPDNLGEIPRILETLAEMKMQGLNLHKAMFLAAIDHRKGAQNTKFWEKWIEYSKTIWDIPVSFAVDDVFSTREFCQFGEASKVRCWVPNITFYAKANGDFYPCCLVGGEAVRTQREYRIGNFHTSNLETLWKYYEPFYYYRTNVCQNFCQFKQLNLNIAGELASQTRLAMP